MFGTVLGDVQNGSVGAHQCVFGADTCSIGGNVFKLESYNVNFLGKLADLVQIVVGSGDFKVGHLAGWSIGFRGKRMNAVAHAAGSDGKHAA